MSGSFANTIVDTADGEAFTVGTGLSDFDHERDDHRWFQRAAEFYPAATIGTTKKPSVMIIGDSLSAGVTDAAGYQGDVGIIARSIGLNFGYISSSVPGDRVQCLASTYTKRLSLAAYVTSVIFQLGVNDLSAGFTAANMQGWMSTVWSAFANSTRKTFQTTITPTSTSTDAFATLTNQTPASSDSVRKTVNQFIRSCPNPLAGMFPMADVYEPYRDAGKWNIVPASTSCILPITPDGVHPSVAAYDYPERANIIPKVALSR
jgi:lysophospholipase L1-like esterase